MPALPGSQDRTPNDLVLASVWGIVCAHDTRQRPNSKHSPTAENNSSPTIAPLTGVEGRKERGRGEGRGTQVCTHRASISHLQIPYHTPILLCWEIFLSFGR